MSTPPGASDSPQSTGLETHSEETLSVARGIVDTGSPSAANPCPPTPPLVAPAVEAPVTDPMSLVGHSFDDLELLEYLGRGAMGVVFKARQKSLDRIVAVKLLLAQHFLEPLRLARFQAEARAAASLSHTNIVQVYQVGQCTLGHYFVMEYLDGPSLEERTHKERLPIPQVVAILIRIAKAVHYAHTRGIVHRDLKPSNIMFDSSHRPVVMDFGIAKFMGRASSLTQTGALMGTPAFMAPEQAGESTDSVGPHSDVYSLGAILYTLLSGRVPFEEETPMRTIVKVISSEMPPPIGFSRPDVPEELERICQKCLSKQPSDRYPTALEFANDLLRFRALLKEQQSAAPRQQPPLFLESVSTGRQLHVSRKKTVVGRTSDCDIVLRAADVSKQHCRILLEADEIIVEDLGSSNGTFVNDLPIKRAALRDGDRLRIAEHEFRVWLTNPPG